MLHVCSALVISTAPCLRALGTLDFQRPVIYIRINKLKKEHVLRHLEGEGHLENQQIRILIVNYSIDHSSEIMNHPGRD